MAAVLSPHRFPPAVADPRPRLHVVPAARPGSRGAATGPHPAALLAVALLLVLVVGGVLALGRGAFAGLAPAPPAPVTAPGAPTGGTASGGSDAVVVRPGDTLWSIARRLQPAGDVRALVDALVAANGSTNVVAGDRVVLPR